MLTSNGGIYPNKFVVAKSDILRGLMFGIQDGPRVNNIYFILVSLEIGWILHDVHLESGPWSVVGIDHLQPGMHVGVTGPYPVVSLISLRTSCLTSPSPHPILTLALALGG